MFSVNVAGPQHPIQINLFPQIPHGPLSRSGDLLAIADGSGLYLASIADPAAPNVVGTYWLRGAAGAGHAFTLSAAPGTPQSFAAPLSATIEYSDIDIRPIGDEAALVLQWWNGAAWRAPDCGGTITRDLAQNRITAPICAAGAYRLVGPAHQVLLPLVGL